MRASHKTAPLCKCGHKMLNHTHHGGSFRFPIFTDCKECACNKYKSDGKPTGGTGPK